MKTLLAITLFLTSSFCFGSTIDSLKSVLEETNDPSQIGILNYRIAEEYSLINLDSSIFFYLEANKAFHSTNDLSRIASSYDALGFALTRINELDSAETYYNLSFEYASKAGDVNLMLIAKTHYINDILERKLLYNEALHEALDIKHQVSKLNNDTLVFLANRILFNIYYHFPEFEDEFVAIGEENQRIIEVLNIDRYKQTAYFDLALAYGRTGKHQEAINTYYKTIPIIGESNIAAVYNNMASEFGQLEQNDSAIYYYLKAETFGYKYKNNNRLGATNLYLGKLYLKLNDPKSAVKRCKQGLTFFQASRILNRQDECAECIYEAYKSLGDVTNSLLYLELHLQIKDSLNMSSAVTDLKATKDNFEYRLQTVKDSLAHLQSQELLNTQLEKQHISASKSRQQKIGLIIISLLIATFALFALQKFRSSKKQKEIIEEVHKEITDSINYAERIQRSFLATKELLDENLNEYFVYFQPKDVVSGDFYWATKLSNNHFTIVNADSTGHGVPGAIMSILNISALETAIARSHTSPAAIFNDARTTIIERLKKDGSENGGKDGMDASIICFDFENKIMHYTAAQNPIWVIRSGAIIEIKPQKIPVGKHDNDHIPFEEDRMDLQEGDVVYTLTDGYPDQFGGDRGKKFMSKNLKKFLVDIHQMPIKQQETKLAQAFENWKGDLEQVDDVCIIGIRI